MATTAPARLISQMIGAKRIMSPATARRCSVQITPQTRPMSPTIP